MKRVFLPILACLCACAPDFDSQNVDASNVGRVHAVKTGVIVSKRSIKIKNAGDQNSSALLGAGAGAVGGAFFGGSTEGHLLGAALGAAAGSIAGQAIAKGMNVNGFEYDVKLDDSGEVLSITQGIKPDLSVGQKVLVKSTGGTLTGYNAFIVAR